MYLTSDISDPRLLFPDLNKWLDYPGFSGKLRPNFL